MYKLLLAVIVVAYWVGGASSQQVTGYANIGYDCRRTGTTCDNTAQCRADTGHCDCTGLAFQGYDCAVGNAVGNYDGATCPTCDADGTLFCDAANCYCKQFSHGTNCELRRISHECLGDGEVSLSVTPEGTFTGYMYQMNKRDTCDYSTAVADGTMPITLTVDDADCGAAQDTGTDSEGRVIYNNTFEFMIEFDDQFMTEHDTIIQVVCVETEGGLVTMEASVNIHPTDYSNIQKIAAEANMPAGLSLVLTRDPNDPTFPLDDPTILGTELTLLFTLIEGDYFFYEINSIIADDCNDGSGYQVTLVEEGCLTAFAKSIVTDFDNTITGTDAASGNPTKIMHVVFDAFKFSGDSSSVCFTAEAAVCKNDVFPCTRELCDLVVLILPGGALDRQLSNGQDARKREDFSFQTEEFAGGSLTVGYSAQEVQPRASLLKETTQLIYDKTRCMQGMAFILPLVVMAMMLIVSMSTTFAFCVKSGAKGSSLWKLDGFRNILNASQISDADSLANKSRLSDANQNIIKGDPRL